MSCDDDIYSLTFIAGILLMYSLAWTIILIVQINSKCKKLTRLMCLYN